MYTVISLAYWPIWLVFKAVGYEAAGITLGSIVVISGWAIVSRINSGSWKFWGAIKHLQNNNE